MDFGSSLKATLYRGGYSLVSEFVTEHRRLAVRVQVNRSSEVVAMFQSDAIELARGTTTLLAILTRNRAVQALATMNTAAPVELLDRARKALSAQARRTSRTEPGPPG